LISRTHCNLARSTKFCVAEGDEVQILSGEFESRYVQFY
jgi:hypothetical protein